MDVRTLCLGMLTFGDASGYEIKKLFAGPLRHFFDASYGSIYPALNKLTRDGLVTCTEMAQDKKPDKKVYRLTAKGRMTFVDALGGAVGRDRFRSEFVATVMFAHLLPPRELATMIDDRVAEYGAALAELEACVKNSRTAGQNFVNGMGIAVYRAARDYLEEHRHLVEGEALLAGASGR